MDYKMLVQELLQECVIAQRKKWRLTQEQMAERLHISSRAYSNAERGRSCLSAQPLVSLLMHMHEDDIQELLSAFNRRINELEEYMII